MKEEARIVKSPVAKWAHRPSRTEILAEAMSYLSASDLTGFVQMTRATKAIADLKPYKIIYDEEHRMDVDLLVAAVRSCSWRMCDWLNCGSALDLGQLIPFENCSSLLHTCAWLETNALAIPWDALKFVNARELLMMARTFSEKMVLGFLIYPVWSLMYRPRFERNMWVQKVTWRGRLARWVESVADVYHLTPAFIADTMSAFDLYLAFTEKDMSSLDCQLLAVTCAMISLRAHGKGSISSEVREKTSEFTQEQVQECEREANKLFMSIPNRFSAKSSIQV